MMVLQRGNGLPVTLEQELTSGGEGKIYTVRGMSNLAAKIYHNPTPTHADKLKYMLNNRPIDSSSQNGHCSIAWPIDSLYDVRGKYVGFLMPFIQPNESVPLLKLYNPRDRAKDFPNFTWRYLLRTAINLTTMLDILYSHGYVVGDINESNVLVNSAALVTLVDCDSIQVPKGGGQFFCCTVGKSEYTPPELQGLDFSHVNRSRYHDSFGLGVLIFLMLMEGNHPFSGVWRGSGVPSTVEQYIKDGYCPYIGSPYLSPPPLALSIDMLHPALKLLVIRCFRDGHYKPYTRPTASEWRQALKEAEQNLTCCRINNQHWYSQHLSSCPWCTRVLSGIPDPFPPQDASKKNSSNVEILVQTSLPSLQQQQVVQKNPSVTYPQQVKPKRSRKNRGYVLGILSIALLISMGLCYFTNQSNAVSQLNGSSQNAQASQIVPTSGITPTTTLVVPTPTDTATPTPSPNIIATPTDAEVQSAITFYYNNESYWAGQRMFVQMDQMNYVSATGPANQPKLTVCVEYDFADAATPYITAGTTRRIFYLEYINDSWVAVNMGDWMSC